MESPASYVLTLHLEGTADDRLRLACERSGHWYVDDSNKHLKVQLHGEHTSSQGLDGFLGSLLDDHSPVWEAASQVGTARTASVGVLFEAEQHAMLTLGLGTDVMRRLCDLGFDLETCAYPVSEDAEQNGKQQS
jgi:hypothetical protein